jgi:hypothetical protein
MVAGLDKVARADGGARGIKPQDHDLLEQNANRQVGDLASPLRQKNGILARRELGPITQAQITRLFRVIEAYIKGVAQEDFIPSPGIQCAACEFFNECRAWRQQNRLSYQQ